MSNEFRKFTRLLNRNGYSCDRIKGSHYIFHNRIGETISVPKIPNRLIVERLIKEHNLV